MAKGDKIGERQELFCQYFIISLNATQAAKEAGYSEKTAQEIGSQNLSKLIVQARIAELQKERAEKIKVTQEDVLRELKNFAYSDITETLMLSAIEIQDLAPEVRRLITKFKRHTKSYKVGEETFTEETIELWFVDKVKIFEMLNRHIGFYEADNDQLKGTVTVFELPSNGRG